MAVAVGLMVMLETIGDQQGLWTVGLIPGLIGIVLVAFAWFQRPPQTDEMVG